MNSNRGIKEAMPITVTACQDAGIIAKVLNQEVPDCKEYIQPWDLVGLVIIGLILKLIHIRVKETKLKSKRERRKKY